MSFVLPFMPGVALGGGGAFVDPRVAAGKVNLLRNQTAFLWALITQGVLIVGPDGVTQDARRYTATDNGALLGFGSYPNGWTASPLPALDKYTASFYCRTPSDQNVQMYISNGSGSKLGPEPAFIVRHYAGWTLVEAEWTAVTTTDNWGIAFGLNTTLQTGEWLEIARPYIYRGAKLT